MVFLLVFSYNLKNSVPIFTSDEFLSILQYNYMSEYLSNYKLSSITKLKKNHFPVLKNGSFNNNNNERAKRNIKKLFTFCKVHGIMKI